MTVRFRIDPGSELSAVIVASEEELGEDVTFMQTSDPSHGELVAFEPSGAFTYRPDPGFSGIDSFSVSASDGDNLVLTTIFLDVRRSGKVLTGAWTLAPV